RRSPGGSTRRGACAPRCVETTWWSSGSVADPRWRRSSTISVTVGSTAPSATETPKSRMCDTGCEPGRRDDVAAKNIFGTGGVGSSLGKGLAWASSGSLLEARGFKVTLQKMDPYINVDAGTMTPYQHGEVFVTDDGGETDLDLGHYERFPSVRVTRQHNVTT